MPGGDAIKSAIAFFHEVHMKLELEALSAYGDDFLLEKYLPEKVAEALSSQHSICTVWQSAQRLPLTDGACACVLKTRRGASTGNRSSC
mmetsp:Transcript_17503/g.70910  ORF Transcript_17503/g.70910 Transcript_17503/m.70910 type:complete len:89 (+) Transcript_17503:1208-1474(+)